MRWKQFIFTLCVCTALGSGQFAQAQSKAVLDKIDKADRYFLVNDFANALTLYLDLDKTQPKDATTSYRIGVCYLSTEEDQLKAIPYLEYALNSKETKLPAKLHLQLGEAYHLAYRCEEAISAFSTYRTSLDAKDPKLTELDRKIQIARNAKSLLKDTAEVFIQNLGQPINSKFTEYGPVISADESVLIYTSLKPTADKNVSAKKEYEDIMIADKKNDRWENPKSIGLNAKVNIGSVGLSPDGQRLLIYMDGINNSNGDIYSCQLTGTQWNNPSRLSNKINSKYQESSGSLTPDERVMYFSSNRPGGLGGLDIYRVEKKADGEWGEAVNAGASINTPYDEDAPFIHPDGKTLYFSSNGHNTMGGNDIFRITLNNLRSVPSNMGFPINTVYNDNFFVLSADGKKGYFSSNRPGGYGGQDIYFLGIPEEQGVVPLTMMKGRITTGDIQVPTKIRIIDKETKEMIKNVYSPNSKTGKYLIIFPPGHNYDMIIEAEGFLPYLVNINVPNQNYFYELYQEIELKAIRKAGKIVGQEISVKNVFTDVEKDSTLADPSKFGANNLDLYELMENIIAASDSVALDFLLDVMYKNGPDLTVVPSEPMKGTYYYDDPNGKLKPVMINGDTIYTLPSLANAPPPSIADNLGRLTPSVTKEDITAKTVFKPNLTYIFYFKSNGTELGKEAIPELEKLNDYLKKNPNYGIRISGFADADGTKERNQQISEERARQVTQYMIKRGVLAKRMVSKGYGQAPNASKSSTEEEKRKFRIAEIIVIETAKLNAKLK